LIVFFFLSQGTITYSLLGGNSYFSINPTTGQLTTINVPPIGTQTLTVQAISSTGQTAVVPVTVTTSCNGGTTGTTPTFTSSFYSFTLTTCTSGGYVGQVFANANGGTVTYQIVGGNSYFLVNPSTGLITALTTPPSGTQTFTVQAFSSLGQTVTVPVTVTTTCSGTTGTAQLPVFSQSAYSLTASTCTSGSYVGQITAQSSFGIK
jgi:hypothetical protein